MTGGDPSSSPSSTGSGGAADGGRPLRADARRNRARILRAAEEVFAEQGASAATEEVARRAGVAVGTVFRHFPTKDDLLAAIMKEARRQLADEADALLASGDPATALFAFFSRVLAQASAKRTVVGALADAGSPIRVADQVDELRAAVAALLARAQEAGAVRPDARIDEVMALLTATTQAAVQSAWPPDLQSRTLAVIETGLRRE
ncbi:helix-turn-helix transcriptional regulator [Streptomonospora sp. PA3]|uniref:TetR/AcrR family transcriptional regulator n=1 Tax=Streptomonospora sp. PA3 TaxID=2607326 RepID=UPI0012DC9014|nr:TetR/AcrR family transcriptional regulator [Streptomonospora sp. PA3]MUL42357.1 helix-turn-helix transcriptional regulator [Streptomonospora sp. PA3]